MLNIYAFEMLSGQRLTPLPVTSATWKIVTNADDSIQITVPAKDPAVKALRVWENTTEWRNGLYAEVDGTPVAAGPIIRRKYSQEKGEISITAGGIRAYLNKRTVVPVAARGQSLTDATTGDPVLAYDTNLSNLSYGTIAKRYIQIAQAWPLGNIPITLPADVAGTRVRNVKAIDLKLVGKLIDDLANLENGPDFAFRVRRREDGLGVYWEMQHGSETVPRLGSTDAANTKWSIGAWVSGATNLDIDNDGSAMASGVWVLGGRGNDKVIIRRAESTALAAAGFPLIENVDTGHSDIADPATAQSYANQGVRVGALSSSFWTMTVRARQSGSPMLGDYWLGDMVTVNIDDAEPVLPAGDYVRRVAAISGNEEDAVYPLTFAEALV